jgi:hypothetical protein
MLTISFNRSWSSCRLTSNRILPADRRKVQQPHQRSLIANHAPQGLTDLAQAPHILVRVYQSTFMGLFVTLTTRTPTLSSFKPPSPHSAELKTLYTELKILYPLISRGLSHSCVF